MYSATFARANRAAPGLPCSIASIEEAISCQPRLDSPENALNSPTGPLPGPVSCVAWRSPNRLGRATLLRSFGGGLDRQARAGARLRGQPVAHESPSVARRSDLLDYARLDRDQRVHYRDEVLAFELRDGCDLGAGRGAAATTERERHAQHGGAGRSERRRTCAPRRRVGTAHGVLAEGLRGRPAV